MTLSFVSESDLAIFGVMRDLTYDEGLTCFVVVD